jgi:uncharacterized protein YcgL (UPF0745 family)
MVIFFGDPNTVLVMTPNLKHALNNLDITNIIQHLIEELPYHIENLEARQDLEKNASNIFGEKPNEGIR